MISVSYMTDWKQKKKSWGDEPSLARLFEEMGESNYLVVGQEDAESEKWPGWSTHGFGVWYSPVSETLGESWHSVVRMMEVRTRTPVNLETRLERLEGSVLKLSEALLSRPVVSTTWIVDLNSPEFVPKHPIPVVVEEYSDEVVATFPEVEAHGWGTTPAEALNDLKEQIVLLYQELTTADPEELGKLPTAWARVLQHYVAKGEEIQ
jgi:hypothetical protein